MKTHKRFKMPTHGQNGEYCSPSGMTASKLGKQAVDGIFNRLKKEQELILGSSRETCATS